MVAQGPPKPLVWVRFLACLPEFVMENWSMGTTVHCLCTKTSSSLVFSAKKRGSLVLYFAIYVLGDYMNNRKSFWFVIKKNVLEDVVKQSKSYSDILRFFKFPRNGSNLKNLKQRIEQEAISTVHFFKVANKVKDSSEIFKNNSFCDTKTLKKRILKENLKEYKCEGEGCELKGIWIGKTLSLQLDHINGVRNDNRLDNLRFLCPNCHSQTSTFGSKNFQRKFIVDNKIKETRECRACGRKINNVNGGCKSCIQGSGVISNKFNITKETLISLLETETISSIAKDYGVTGNTVKKRCKKLGLWTQYKERKNKEKNNKQEIKKEIKVVKEKKLNKKKENCKKIEKLFKQNNSPLEISKKTGIPRTTVRDYIKKIIK